MSIVFSQKVLFGLLGGLGLFLFGMRILSEGLQKIAGNRMRKILAALTNNRLVGALVGIAVTAIIQSSSAATVMVVGFVNAGLMSLLQAIGVVLGANIGATFTAQLIAFNISQYALPAVAVGVGLKLFSRRNKYNYCGEIILGFGLLFLGLATMKLAFEPLKASTEFRDLFLLVGDHKILGVLLGALLTVLVQSSSATIGITLALATSGLLTFEASIALILGENIGTTITANLAAIGTSTAAKRTAFAHFLFNLLGTVIVLLLFPLYLKLIALITPGEADFIIQTQAQADSFSAAIGDKPFIARHIANTHTMFNLLNAILFLPAVGLLAKLSTLLIRGEEEHEALHVKFIDDRVLNTPPIAIGQARRETKRMADIALEMLDETNRYLADGDQKRIIGLEKREKLVDLLQKEITDFLVSLSQKSISAESSKAIASLIYMVNDLERIGDHCKNLWKLGVRKNQWKITFSDVGERSLSSLAAKAHEFLGYVVAAMGNQEQQLVAAQSMEYEDTINLLERTLRKDHITRLNTGECAVQPGLIYIDMLHNYEKIGDHTFYLSEAIRGDK